MSRPSTNASRLREVTSAVERATTLLPFPLGCLAQALTTRTLLSRLGESAMVVIGVRKNGPLLDAHAWVEVDAHRVDASQPRFAGLVQLR